MMDENTIASFNTLFMFIAVSSFAFTSVKSIKDSLLGFFKYKISKQVTRDEKRQDKIFNFILSPSSIEYFNTTTDSDDSLLEDIDLLNDKLKRHNKYTIAKTEFKLDTILKKYRLVSFSVGLQMFLIIILSSFYQSKIIEDVHYTSFILFSTLTSLYILMICISYKRKIKRAVLYNFTNSAVIIGLLFIFILSINLSFQFIDINIFTWILGYLVLQFILLTSVFPLFLMDWFMNLKEKNHNTIRDEIWEEFPSIEKIKNASQKKSSNIKKNTKKYLNNFTKKINDKNFTNNQ